MVSVVTSEVAGCGAYTALSLVHLEGSLGVGVGWSPEESQLPPTPHLITGRTGRKQAELTPQGGQHYLLKVGLREGSA